MDRSLLLFLHLPKKRADARGRPVLPLIVGDVGQLDIGVRPGIVQQRAHRLQRGGEISATGLHVGGAHARHID